MQQSRSQTHTETEKAFLLTPIHLLSIMLLYMKEVKQLIEFSSSVCGPTAICFRQISQDRINTVYVLYVNGC